MNLALRRFPILILVSFTLVATSFQSERAKYQSSSEQWTMPPESRLRPRDSDFSIGRPRGMWRPCRQRAIPSLAGAFGNAESLVKAHQAGSGGRAGRMWSRGCFCSTRLGARHCLAPSSTAESSARMGRRRERQIRFRKSPAREVCGGVAGGDFPQSAERNFSVILQQTGSDWKLGDIYIEPATIGGRGRTIGLRRARGNTKRRARRTMRRCLYG